MMRICATVIAAAFSVQPLPQADGPLEPSVQNEVDHAVDMGERWLAGFAAHDLQKSATNHEPRVTSRELGLTNGLTRAEIALKLVSSQRGGGWWLVETNAAPTRLAIEILKGL